jgi:hypothetical protein
MTPTVLRSGPYRLFFYSGDRVEPPHIHIERENRIAKFWLEPVRMQSSGGFRPNEIRRIQRLIEENQNLMLEKWNEYFSD